MKTLSAVGLGILLFMQPVWVVAGVPGEQVHQSVNKLLAIQRIPGSRETPTRMSDGRNSKR